jgi:nucleotidyltransferase/DNA polymerase involved in DNA repair
MQFSESEKLAMLKIKGVGSTIISRLEQIGLHSLVQLSNQDAAIITKQISEMMGSTCWHNSPQARSSIQAVIDLANSKTSHDSTLRYSSRKHKASMGPN